MILKLFELHGVNVFTGPAEGWQMVLGGLQNAFDLAHERSVKFGEELTRERNERERAQHMLGKALGVIEHAIRRIRDSSRFGASIDALRIRIWLLERFGNFKPEPKSWMERELEMARADLARRERHKKARPSAGAGV